MADNEEVEATASPVKELEGSNRKESERDEAIPCGNGWEVVSLTASTYAAASGPRGNESIYEDKGSALNDEAETSRTLFMSGHFVFPPSQHENLPRERENIEVQKGVKKDDLVSEMELLKEGKLEHKEEENLKVDGFYVTEELPGIPLFGEKGSGIMSTHTPTFDELTALHGLNFNDMEQDTYGTAKFCSFHSGTVISNPTVFDESSVVNDLVEAADHGVDPSYSIQSPKSGKENEAGDSELPCRVWWKRGLASICSQAKDTSTFWSVFVAAAVMGLVVLGQQWQLERWQVLQQRWHLSVGDEKSGRMLSRLKDVIVGGNRRDTYVNAASAER